MISNYENIINAICDRFHNHITPLKVVNWLENFDRSDWKKALIVLNSFEYYTTKDVIKEFDAYLNLIYNDITKTNKVYAIPVGQVGKSGLAMIYYLKKTNSFVKNKLKILGDDDFSKIEDNDNIILVDDFSGSGETISLFYNSIKDKLPKNHNVFVLTVAFLTKAKIHLESIGIQIYGNLRHPAFSSRGSVFGYSPKMKAIREFCFRYGNLIYSEEDYKNKKTRLHPLGFANSQALIGFEHAIPNNTLSIIWSDKKRLDKDEIWQPVFPRRTQTYIKEASEFKKTSTYWISLLYKLGLEQNFNFDANKYSKYNLKTLSVLLLKRKRNNPIYICQFLGINLDEYNLIIDEGIKSNIFDEQGELTNNAIRVIDEVRKKIKFEKEKYIKPELIIEEDMVYLPKVFQGSS
ncbi:MAG: hypothetical protein JNM71_10700 [Flavobacterium lindanitolerans]|uniref:phosphoribosyltransferase-like protein n=1 Tax=Flavobacterium lindanitolerans TaxID=428988 RepID=UPI001A377554|nr:hypothetical protein [Flavobacterium lindanitolerans]MBL7868477.1 hypothetical protein [Flavobacterium lindanitolerans]